MALIGEWQDGAWTCSRRVRVIAEAGRYRVEWFSRQRRLGEQLWDRPEQAFAVADWLMGRGGLWWRLRIDGVWPL